MSTHKTLEIWVEGINLVSSIYKITSTFPKEEIYGLVSQMRRAAISISINIAEGAARNSRKEYTRFLNISLASLAELETQNIIAQRLGLIPEQLMTENINRLRQKLLNFIKFVKSERFRPSQQAHLR